MEIALVLVILVVAIVLFATERYPVDLTAMLILGGLMGVSLVAVPGGWIAQERWVNTTDCVSGFSNPATLTVGAMFILSAALQKTGSVELVGRALFGLGRHQTVLLMIMMLAVGVVSAFVNNTAAVAIFLPLVLAVCAKRGFSPSKLLIPLSFASQFGGVCTLIGTSTNLLVNSISKEQGYGGFTMFEFTRLGLILLGTGILYFLLIGRWMLPSHRVDQLTEVYDLQEYITEVRVLDNSPLINKTVLETKLGQTSDVSVLEIIREKKKIWSPLQEPLRAGDILLIRGGIKQLMALKAPNKLEIEPQFQLRDETLETEDLVLAEAMIAPRSRLTGRSLAEIDFRRRYSAIVLAIQRRGHTLSEPLSKVRLRLGDALLLQGHKADIGRLRRDESFIILEEFEPPVGRRQKIPVALAIIASAVGLAALNVMPIMAAAILGCVAMVLTRCLSLEEAYNAIDWRVIFLLAGVLPLGTAMTKSGAATFLATQAVQSAGHFSHVAVLAAIFLLTVALTSFMSNYAAAVLLAPIAISTALDLHVSVKPFLMAVMFAASTCFATPVGYQTNLMVYNPGGYRFRDFLKVGLPLNLIFCAVATYYIPKFWPFHP